MLVSGTKQESNRLCCGMTNPELRWEVAMPLLAADPVTILPEQREVLEQLVRTHSTPQQLALRARMILHAADGVGVRALQGDGPEIAIDQAAGQAASACCCDHGSWLGESLEPRRYVGSF